MGWALCALFASPAQAGTSAMVMNVSGDVVIDTFGKTAKIEPFSRLLDGDRVRLGADGKLILVYAASGRQETWVGAGQIAAGEEQSTPVSGNPRVEARQLPRQVVQQMARTPQVDSTGKTGMVRMRAIVTPAALATLEQKYQEMRSQAAPEDRTPEVFLLAGLFEKGAHDRLEQELARMEKAYPGDDSIRSLARIYVKAISDARQGGQR